MDEAQRRRNGRCNSVGVFWWPSGPPARVVVINGNRRCFNGPLLFNNASLLLPYLGAADAGRKQNTICVTTHSKYNPRNWVEILMN